MHLIVMLPINSTVTTPTRNPEACHICRRARGWGGTKRAPRHGTAHNFQGHSHRNKGFVLCKWEGEGLRLANMLDVKDTPQMKKPDQASKWERVWRHTHPK
jgi:hypothetical protein